MNHRSLPATRVLFPTFLFFFVVVSLAGQPGGAGRVHVIDDFESGASAAKWSGVIELSPRHSSHGESAAQVQFNGRRTEISTTAVPRDWRDYDRLLFDIYCDRQTISTLTL